MDCFDPLAPIALEVMVTNFTSISAFDFTLNFDVNEYTYATTSQGELNGYTVDDTEANQGILRWFWNSADGSGVCLEDGSLLFFARFSNDKSCTPLLFEMDQLLSSVTINYNTDGTTCEQPINFVTEPFGSCLMCNGTLVGNTVDISPSLVINGPAFVDEEDQVCFDFTMTDFLSLSSLQFTITFNPEVLQYVNLNEGFLPTIPGGLITNENSVENGLLGLIWFEQGDGICADPNDVFIPIVLRCNW